MGATSKCSGDVTDDTRAGIRPGIGFGVYTKTLEAVTWVTAVDCVLYSPLSTLREHDIMARGFPRLGRGACRHHRKFGGPAEAVHFRDVGEFMRGRRAIHDIRRNAFESGFGSAWPALGGV